jgi:hypothetical protein
MGKSVRHRVVVSRQTKKIQEKKCDGLPPACELTVHSQKSLFCRFLGGKMLFFWFVGLRLDSVKASRNCAPKVREKVKFPFLRP